MNRLARSLSACLVLVPALAAPALEIDCVDLAGSGFREAALVTAAEVVTVAVDEDVVLGARAGAVAIYDAADPDQPQLLATWTPPAGAVARLALDLPWAAVLRDDGVLHVLDLSDPSSPVALPTGEPVPTPAVALALDGQRIAVIADATTVHLLEIRPGASPVAVWTHTLDGEAAAVALGAGYAYVAGPDFGLLTLDASDDTPEPMHELTAPYPSDWRDLAPFGDRLLAAEHDLVEVAVDPGWVLLDRYRLRSLDLADPGAPALGEAIDWPGATELQVAVAGEHGVMWTGHSLAAVAMPATLPSAVHGELARDQQVLALDGGAGLAVAATDGGFRLYTVATPATPAPRVWYDSTDLITGTSRHIGGEFLVVRGDHEAFGSGAYQGWRHRLVAHDLLTDEIITLLLGESSGYLDLPVPLEVASGVGPGDERVYFRLGDGPILMSPITAAAPQTPLPVDGLLAASGGWAFVAGADTLYRINCWDTENPYVASVHALPGQPTAIESPFGSAVLLGYADGLVEVWWFSGDDLQVEPFQAAGAVRSLAVCGGLAIIGTDSDLQAVAAFAIGIPDKDLDDEVWHLVDTEYPVTELEASCSVSWQGTSGYVYAGQGDRGLRLVHTSASDDVTDLGYGGPPLERLDLVRTAGGGTALLAAVDELGVLLTSQCVGVPGVDEAPPAPVLSLVAAPNPFNPRTTLRFSLDRPQHARLAVHDLRGRLVRILVDGPRSAGEHAVAWDGRDARGADCASGVYLACLRAEAGAVRTKLVLVR